MEPKKAEERISRKSDSEKKTIKKTSKFTGDEYRIVESKMALMGMKNYSSFVRNILFGYRMKYEITENTKLIFELNKAGNNFNQLVKTFNTFAKSGQQEIWLNEKHREVIKNISDIINKINQR